MKSGTITFTRRKRSTCIKGSLRWISERPHKERYVLKCLGENVWWWLAHLLFDSLLIVATKTENLPEPCETTWNHLKSPATTQKRPLKTICNPPEPFDTTQNHPEPVRIWLEPAVIFLKSSIAIWEHPDTINITLKT